MHITTEVAAAAFALKDFGVDLTSRDEVQAPEILVEDSLIGAQVHVSLKAVFKHEDLAMAIGIKGAAVDIQVTLHLDGGDGQTFVFEEFG